MDRVKVRIIHENAFNFKDRDAASFPLSLKGESHKISCPLMKKPHEPFPERAPSVRRTLEKLEIEDGERRVRVKGWFRRLFGRKDRLPPRTPGR
jgi:hypothetical protein